MTPSISRQQPDRQTVLALAASIEAEDGAPPLSDQALAQLDRGNVTHLLARDGAAVVGYAQLDGESLEIAARADAVPGLLAAAGDGPLLVWSHGRRSRVVGSLEQARFVRERELHQLRRPLDADHPVPADPPLADDITVRAFVAGQDDAAWLALNAAAFAHHPEQGGWDERDLEARMAEPWFDPAGFLLAERDGELLGFHWTKVHDTAPSDGAQPDGAQPDGAQPDGAQPDGPLGEVYVLGVSPQAQGLGLGRGLLVRGLRLLAGRGCPAVLLYVDGDNDAALHLYAKDGFVTYDLDVQWRRG
ncbi:mycothiol synthase [uncultured Jatrophihabitans sp.]|uniref:mycothiol synthase n=1 Tax=uncultured Jatrophihabitans sp. TaxID=1610747 RepID=UPI0035CAE64F